MPLPSLRVARSFELDEDNPPLRKYKELSGIWYENNVWVFYRWEYVPGPGPDDIHFESDDLDRIVNAALNYYFGEPIIIHEWTVPLHKHPEWDAERLPIVIASAATINEEAWKSIHKNYIARRGQLYPHGTLPELFTCLFNPLAHTENPNLTLYLRRDLAEAFIVDSSHKG